jgi:hypothetical protein
MKTTCLKLLNYRVHLFSLFLLLSMTAASQPGLNVYTDMGSNNVSHGLFIKSAAIGSYKFDKYSLETGFQTNLKDNNKLGFSGYTIDASRYLVIKNTSLEINGFYTTTIATAILRETDLGGLVTMRFEHFEIALGTNQRTFILRQRGITNNEIETGTLKIREASNVMYSFTYNLKPAENRWNTGISVTNFDHFTIYQETNPMINLHGSYKMKMPVTLYAQAWYKIAGASNLEVNYFGFYIKSGLIWNF